MEDSQSMAESLLFETSNDTQFACTFVSLQDMETKCAPACQTCHMLTVEGRCPLDPDAPETWEKGSLNKMFEKLTQEPYLSEYSVEILSSPATNGPWVITMENVVTAEEAERLIELGSEEGYERSTDVGKMKADGTTERYERCQVVM